MSFVRDTNHSRGVGAIAATDGRRTLQRQRVLARLAAARDRAMARVVRSSPLSGDVSFATTATRMQAVTSHPPGPKRPKNLLAPVYRGGVLEDMQPYTSHPPGPKPLPNGQWPVSRRDAVLALGAAPVNPAMGHGRRPVLDRGGMIEGEGKSSPISISTPVVPWSSGGGAPKPPNLQPRNYVVLDSKKTPLFPGPKPVRGAMPPPPPPAPQPQVPAPVVLLPVPNVSLPYPGSPNTGGGGGGGGGGTDAPPLEELVDDPILPAVTEPAPAMSNGKKLAIGLGLAGLAFLLYENLR